MSKFYYNQEAESYDAIVVGTGISGGWAAKELCEGGLKTLVLERGRMVNHITDYPTANMDLWDFPNGGALPREGGGSAGTSGGGAALSTGSRSTRRTTST